MEVFWTSLVEPLISALKPRSIVEIGCEHGKNTANLIRYCAAHGVALHVVDPQPLLDEKLLEHCTRQKDFSFTLHVKRSLDALPALSCADLILLDGDHNWYTVRHELQCIEELGKRTGCQPLVLLHDVAWPYARRDMYYAPDDVPADSRQPFARQAMIPGQSELSDLGGMNSALCNALHEGGERNGVLTAVEDFLRDTKEAYQFWLMPAFHGLGILCPVALLKANRDLAALMQEIDRRLADGGLLADLERQRVQLLAQVAQQPGRHPQDIELLERIVEAVSKSTRWRVGSAIVNSVRRLLGRKPQAQITDMVRDIVRTRKEQAARLEDQAARVAQSNSVEVIRAAFHELFYNDPHTWRQTTWLGVTVWKCTFDLWNYQEILHETRPDLIIETGTAFGGSAFFLANVCDQLGHGNILSIDIAPRSDRPSHPRIQYWTGDSIAAETIAHAAQRAASADRVMVILDSDHRCEHVLAELRAYAGFVTRQCYLVVEDSNLNGHPVLVEHGPGPMEALERFRAENCHFQTDRKRERFLLTFNPGGYLRRVRE